MTPDSFHPMQIVAALLCGSLLFSLGILIWKLPQPQTDEFAFAGLVLVGWITVFSFMGGFSIGLFTAIFNVGLGITLLSFTKHFRPLFAVAMLSNILLALFMRGTLPVARSLLALLVLGSLGYSFFKLFSYRNQREDVTFARASLAAVTLLFFLNLLLQNSASIVPISLTVLAIILGVIFTLIAKHYRSHLAVITAFSLAWVAVVYWQINFGM